MAPGAMGPNQKKLLNYGNELKKIVEKSGLKILNNKQMLKVCLYYTLKYKQEIIQIN